MLEHFHNTINASGDTLVAHTITCKSQEERILAIFKAKHIFLTSRNEGYIGCTPFEIMEEYSKLYKAVPITSIRRAMTNLTEGNKLIKTRSMKDGEYGKPNFIWKYNDSFGK